MISIKAMFLPFISVFVLIPGLVSSQLYLQPARKEVGYFTNDSFVITCYTTDTSVDQLSWKDAEGSPLTATSGRIHVQSAPGGQQGLELVFESVQKEDGGHYVCSDIPTSISFDLIVYKSISFGATPKVQHATEGENGLITCTVKADPTPVVNWYFNNTKLINSTKYNIGGDGVLVNEVGRRDAGFYKCKAFVITHLGTQVKELDVNFQVQYAPEWTILTENVVYASFSSTANITCSATANPEPMFQWMKEGEKIYNSSDHMILNYHNESILRFKVTDQEQFGEYVCSVQNPLGEKDKIIDLKEGNAPLAPTVAVNGEEQGSLTLNFKPAVEPGNELPVLGFRVQYTFSSESWDQAITEEFNINEPYVLSNMSYNSEYMFRAAARNAVGYSEDSKVLTYTTHTFQVAPVVADEAISISLSTLALLLNAAMLTLF